MHKITRSHYTILAIALGSYSFALAQGPIIEEISKNSLNVIRHLNRVDEPAMSLASANKIKRAVMANKVLDNGETQMLQYLVKGQSFTIKDPITSADASYSKPVSEEAKAILKSLLLPQPPTAQLPIEQPDQTASAINQKELVEKNLINSAKTGDVQAQFELAELYGNVSESDYYSVDKQVYWLEKASSQGHAGAQYTLAGEYSYGRHIDGTGVNKSYAKAFELYSHSASKGHAGAMVQLGNAYRGGYGVEESPEQATYWFTKSAELGDPWGMYYLGIHYLLGSGAPKSEEKSLFWLKKSAALGNESAEDELWETWGID